MTAYTFKISLDCPHCRGPVSVNGFSTEVLCINCLNPVELPEDWWHEKLDEETLKDAINREAGTGNTASYLGGLSEKIVAGNRPPRCQDCKTDFPQELMVGAVEKGFFACPGCQGRIRVRVATPLVVSMIPDADLLVHEDETGINLANDGITASEAVLVACLGCGGALKVDGSSRTVKCENCANNNYLPDALWLRLHPAKVSHAFFVTLKAKGAAKIPASATPEAADIPDDISSERALRMLKDENLSAEALQKIYEGQKEEDEVLEALAKHRNAPNELLLELVSANNDYYYKVREAVAKRPSLSNEVFQILAEDSDGDVGEALLRRSDIFSLPEPILEDILRGKDLDDLGKAIQDPRFPEWKLFEISDNCTPEDASRIVRAPNTSLRVLRRLGSNPDSRATLRKHKLYTSLSWWRKLLFFGG